MSGSKFSGMSTFSSVAQARRIAERTLPKSVGVAVLAGTESGRTLNDNIDAFDEISFIPRVAAGPAERSQETSVMGQSIAMPILISPTGVQAIHPDGEVAVARAAAEAGTAMSLSSMASRTVEDVVAANPATFFQVYWIGDREQVAWRVERARKAGAKGLILTLDWSFAYWQDWDTPDIPERIDLGSAIRFAPEVLRRPRWLGRYLRQGRLPDLVMPNLESPGQPPASFGTVYERWRATELPTWDDVAWLRELWGGPFMVKGVTHVDDARRAVEVGATAISVSNHGGNNLDGTPAAVRLLPSIADAVGSDIEVLMDGGIRRGSDVVKALALGARAVMIGRPYLWGLAANGQPGVEGVLEVLRAGVDSTLLGLGRSSIRDLSPEDLVLDSGFFRKVGELGGGFSASSDGSLRIAG